MTKELVFTNLELLTESTDRKILSVQFGVGSHFFQETSLDYSGYSFSMSRDHLYLFPKELKGLLFYHPNIIERPYTTKLVLNVETKIIPSDKLDTYLNYYQYGNSGCSSVRLKYVRLYHYKADFSLVAEYKDLDKDESIFINTKADYCMQGVLEDVAKKCIMTSTNN